MMSHVILTRRDLAGSGKSAWQIERSLRRGELQRVAWGKFVLPGVPDDDLWMLNLTVLVARCLDGSAAAYRSAARLHRLDGDWTDLCEVLAPKTCGVREPSVHRSGTIVEEHRTRIQDIACTTVVRTLVDLGRYLSADQVEMALESALRGDPRDPHVWNQQMLRVLTEWPSSPRIPGHGVLREVLARRAQGAVPTASGAETLLLQILRRSGLDRLVLRQPFVDVFASGGRRISGYPDFLFWEAGLAIEVDGKAWHTGNANNTRDNRRENVLGAGLRVLRYTGTQVRSEPDFVAREIAAEYRSLSRRGLPETVTVSQLSPLRFRYSVRSFPL
jgi:very-short-patch-repair endonuclease